MTSVEAKKKVLTENPEMVIETFGENLQYFVFSLRHNTMPPGASTGGACHLVSKQTGEYVVCLITDPRGKINLA